MRFCLFIIPIFIFSCSPTTKKEDNTSNDSSSVAKRVFEPIAVSWIGLKDTTLNGIKLKFRPINKSTFDSLVVLTIKTEIPFQSFDNLLVKSNACQVIKIQNGSTDSLCDVKDDKSGYFEKYTIRGLWKEKNSLVVNYNDWESYDDFLINLIDGSIYQLNSFYEISPDQNHILGYNTAIALNGNDFMYSEISNKSVKTLFQIDFGKVAIKNLKWLNETECVLSGGVMEEGFEFKKELYYVMSIAK